MCSLPARTSILAAANPVGGHYNKAKTVSENLRMGSALLSRFDLVSVVVCCDLKWVIGFRRKRFNLEYDLSIFSYSAIV